MFEHFSMDLDVFLIKSYWISDFVTIFNRFVLEAQMKLDKKFGHNQYLLLEKRSFPRSFVLEFPGTLEVPPPKVE